MIYTLGEISDILKKDFPLKAHVPSALSEMLAKENIFIDCLADSEWKDLAIEKGVSDSREAKLGTLFFCFKGERVDGHDFAQKAVDNGVSAIIAERDPFAEQRSAGLKFPPILLVTSTMHALWKLALAKRFASKATVIGVTGTAGKTTVKEVLAKVLELKGKTEKNFKNFNTQIGLSLSLFNADPEASFWVMEAGISKSGDMDELGSLLQPNISLILNAGQGHVLGLGDEGVEKHKVSLANYTTDGGKVFVNADYPKLIVAHGRNKKNLLRKKLFLASFSTRIPCPCRVSFEGLSDRKWGLFEVRAGKAQGTYEAPFAGPYGAENLAAIVSVCTSLNMTKAEIREGLQRSSLPEQRFEITNFGSLSIIDDSYNANPLSSSRMIEAAATLAKKENKKLVLVMGDMLELGSYSDQEHKNLGLIMLEHAPEQIFWKGTFSEQVKAALTEGNFTGKFHLVLDTDDFMQKIKQVPLENIVILFKASRSIKLEELVKAFKNKVQGN